jgi:hypothetical protein
LWVVGAREMAERSVTERGPSQQRRALPLLEAIGGAQRACAPPESGRDGKDAALGARGD